MLQTANAIQQRLAEIPKPQNSVYMYENVSYDASPSRNALSFPVFTL